MEVTPFLLSALLLGALHTFEADHLAAVGAFVVRRPAPAAALAYGLRWAAGHGGVVLLAGSALLLLGVQVPEGAGTWLERLVGASLVGLGVWVAATASRLHAHPHRHADGTEHSHLHVHPPLPATAAAKRPDHRHASTAMGALHGLAGTAPVVALLPLAQGRSPLLGALFLLAFAVGTALAMGLYALFAGVIVGRAAERSQGLARSLSFGAGTTTALIGVWWLLGGAP